MTASPMIIAVDAQLRHFILDQRKRKGLTQKDMATRLVIPQQSYARFEAAPERARVDRLMAVLRILEVEVIFGQRPTLEDLAQSHEW